MERGRHKDLLDDGGVYTELYETQFKLPEGLEEAPEISEEQWVARLDSEGEDV